ncbi:MAG: hypothetical protein ACRDSJ_08675, partial [Rubrobacteraceae bacterium]
MAAEGALFRFEKWAQVHLGKRPALYYSLHALARRDRRQVVGRETELLIEGFPRSANSFAVVAFRRAQRRKVRLANNLHVPAQVIRAARLGVPALVLIREPKDAVASLAIRDPISIDRALKYYVSFYETVAGYREAYVLGLFEEVTGDYGAVIERVNAKFGTDFLPFRHTERSVRRVFGRIDRVYEKDFEGESAFEDAVSRPSASREEMKQRVRQELEDPARKKLVARAGTIYERLVAGYG